MTFTPREQEFIRLLVERGLGTKEVAWELRIAEKTAHTHRANIMRKLREMIGIPEWKYANVIDLTLYAVTHDMVDMRAIESRYAVAIASPS